jgi:hypothetical protein
MNGYTAVYIQVLYKVTRVRRTGLAVSRGVGTGAAQEAKYVESWPNTTSDNFCLG